MSFVTAQPEMLAAEAHNLAGAGAILAGATTAASAPTTGVVPAAADTVSVLVASRFAAHAAGYQQAAAQATATHEMFVATLNASAASYADTEAANAAATG